VDVGNPPDVDWARVGGGDVVRVTCKILMGAVFAGAFSVAASGAQASQEAKQDEVLACFAAIGSTTDWNTCMWQLFEPCADMDIGSEPHMACLTQQNHEWRLAKLTAEQAVLTSLTEDGWNELSSLMIAWPQFVEDKCNTIAQARRLADAAKLACNLSELALITNELRACKAGMSTETYCQLSGEN